MTLSGLSIVEWAPISGVVPPLTSNAWLALYEKYKLFPQYQKTFPTLSLEEFKHIFFWEYFHRLIGRTIGLVTIIPAFFFWKKNALSKKLARQITLGLALGGFQGALGWFMVKSGLVDNPSVSHFRLAAHLMMALFILAYFFWLALDHLGESPSFKIENPNESTLGIRKLFLSATFPLLITQIIYGAFVAGLKAGFFYNTFPKMNGEWLPRNALYLQPLWINWLTNAATVQWTHRWIAALLLLSTGFLWLHSRSQAISRALKTPISILLFLVFLQGSLGITTLLTYNNIFWASLHQLMGCLLFTCSVWLLHRLPRWY